MEKVAVFYLEDYSELSRKMKEVEYIVKRYWPGYKIINVDTRRAFDKIGWRVYITIANK